MCDIGCGGGKTVGKLANMVGSGKVYGIDYSDLCIKKAEKLNHKNVLCGKVKLSQASVSSLPFELMKSSEKLKLSLPQAIALRDIILFMGHLSVFIDIIPLILFYPTKRKSSIPVIM